MFGPSYIGTIRDFVIQDRNNIAVLVVDGLYGRQEVICKDAKAMLKKLTVISRGKSIIGIRVRYTVDRETGCMNEVELYR